MSKAASRYEDAIDVRLQSQVMHCENRRMRLALEQPVVVRLRTAANAVATLEEQLGGVTAALVRHREGSAQLLMGLHRISQLMDDVLQPLARREADQQKWVVPPGDAPLRLLGAVHEGFVTRSHEELASWEELIAAGRAYRDACRLERSIYSELHDRVEDECLLQVHKSRAYEAVNAEHQTELRALGAELQQLTASVRDNFIVLRRKGKNDTAPSREEDVADDEPTALEPTSAPVPTPLSTEDLDNIVKSVAALHAEYREVAEVQRQRTLAFVAARRELELELTKVQHQHREARKALKEQETTFEYLEARVHGMDPNDADLPQLLEECARDLSPDAREASEEEGFVSSFRRHAPRKAFISSRRTAGEVRGPTIASIAREEAALESRMRAEEMRR